MNLFEKFAKKITVTTLAILLVLGFSVSASAQKTRDVFIDQLNAYRAANGLAAVEFDVRLFRAARDHNTDMRRNIKTLSHTGSNGSSMSDRIAAQGFRACAAAENIARGQRSVDAVFTSWRNSDGHNKNMLNPRMRSVGVHYQPKGNYWTLVLARAC